MVKFCRKNVFLLNSPLLKCKTNETKPVCNYGWKFLPQTSLCYRYFSLKQSWIGARSKCQNRAPKNTAGDLASIPDVTTNKFVSCLAPSYAWIGGRAGNEPPRSLMFHKRFSLLKVPIFTFTSMTKNLLRPYILNGR